MSRSKSLEQANLQLRRDIAYLQEAITRATFRHSSGRSERNQQKSVGRHSKATAKHLCEQEIGFSIASLSCVLGDFDETEATNKKDCVVRASESHLIDASTLPNSKVTERPATCHCKTLKRKHSTKGRRVSSEMNSVHPSSVHSSSLQRQTAKDRSCTTSMSHHQQSATQESCTDNAKGSTDHAALLSFTASEHRKCFGVKEKEQLLAEIEALKTANKQLKLAIARPNQVKRRGTPKHRRSTSRTPRSRTPIADKRQLKQSRHRYCDACSSLPTSGKCYKHRTEPLLHNKASVTRPRQLQQSALASKPKLTSSSS
jgi:hypothetical protein